MSEGSVLQSYVDAVKESMRDQPHLNRLIEGEEHKDLNRKKALEEALDQLNALPPLTNFTFESCPFKSYLIDLAIARLLRSLLFLLERNETDIADGGGVVVKKKQIDLIRQTIDELRKEVIPLLEASKQAWALSDAIGYSGTVYSGYYGNNW